MGEINEWSFGCPIKIRKIEFYFTKIKYKAERKYWKQHALHD